MGAERVDSGRPEEDVRAYRNALGQFATGVAIITAEADGHAAGLTVNSFASVSMEPPLILWSMSRSAKSRAIFENATHFAINILAADQIPLANSFAKSGGDKFAGVDWQHGLGQVPLLDGAACWLECRREIEYEGGDHIIMVGRVERYSVFHRAGLIFDKGRFGLTADHPARVDNLVRQQTPPHEQFLGLLRRTLGHVTACFDSERRAAGVNVNESRVLSYLGRYRQASVRELANESFLGLPDAKEAIGALINAGCVTQAGEDSLDITEAGNTKLHDLMDRAVGFERRLFDGISRHEIEITRTVLKRISERAMSGL